MSYYFEVLPLHPKPKEFELFTSYINRLLELNQITINELAKLAKEPALNLQTSTLDYGHYGVNSIANLTGHTVEQISQTTLLEFMHRFVREPQN